MLIIAIGDAPNLPTGLARITRDLLTQLMEDISDKKLPFARIVQIGIRYNDAPTTWKVYHADTESYGADRIAKVIQWEADPGERVVIFTIMDPARCYGILNELAEINKQYQIRTVGYFPIDSTNVHGRVGGPAAETLARYDHVLAYGKYGAKVIKKSIEFFIETKSPEYAWLTTLQPIKWLPHGIDNYTFNIDPPADEAADPFAEQIKEWLGPAILVGSCATNQPRKDWGTTFAAFKQLSSDYKYHLTGIKFWIHIDRVITDAWSIPELAEIYALNNEKLLVTTFLSDDQLAFMYRLCSATFANGLGEGFGYPAVESLACGTPAVHVDFAGGEELIPQTNWKVYWDSQRQEGPYALIRPILEPYTVKKALAKAIDFKQSNPHLVSTYLNGAVQHLFWPNLWERWRSWFRSVLVNNQ